MNSTVFSSEICRFILLLALTIPLVLADGKTKIWLNTVSGYSQLESCAVTPLSTIVRDMSQGCGDGNSVTSYTCFCTDSYTQMSSIISEDVSSYCRNSSAVQQISSALAVFDNYCALGVEAGLTVSTAPASATASATATPAASSAIATPTTSAESSSSTSNTRTTAIAAGIAVPLGTMALAVGAFFLWRARRKGPRASNTEGGDGENKPHVADTPAINRTPMGELLSDERYEAQGDWSHPQELDSATKGGVERQPVISELEAGSGRREGSQ